MKVADFDFCSDVNSWLRVIDLYDITRAHMALTFSTVADVSTVG